MRGLVIKSTGSSYIVRLDDGKDAECRIKGNFRIRGIRSTNPVAVGDYVTVSGEGLEVSGARKMIINDKLYILREGVMYDATGKQVGEVIRNK